MRFSYWRGVAVVALLVLLAGRANALSLMVMGNCDAGLTGTYKNAKVAGVALTIDASKIVLTTGPVAVTAMYTVKESKSVTTADGQLMRVFVVDIVAPTVKETDANFVALDHSLSIKDNGLFRGDWIRQ